MPKERVHLVRRIQTLADESQQVCDQQKSRKQRTKKRIFLCLLKFWHDAMRLFNPRAFFLSANTTKSTPINNKTAIKDEIVATVIRSCLVDTDLASFTLVSQHVTQRETIWAGLSE